MKLQLSNITYHYC